MEPRNIDIEGANEKADFLAEKIITFASELENHKHLTAHNFQTFDLRLQSASTDLNEVDDKYYDKFVMLDSKIVNIEIQFNTIRKYFLDAMKISQDQSKAIQVLSEEIQSLKNKNGQM